MKRGKRALLSAEEKGEAKKIEVRNEPQFFFTPVYSSTVFVWMVVTGLPDLSGAAL